MPRADTPRCPRKRERFNDGWLFQRGDPRDARGPLNPKDLGAWLLPMTAQLESAARPRRPRPAAEPEVSAAYLDPDYDDSAWRRLDLPHDWGIEGPFDQSLSGETGKLPWSGVGWYRKSFSLSEACRKKAVELCIDGAMAYSSVWLNGKLVGGWPYGYSSFAVDLTPRARFGERNVLAVRLDNPAGSSRWYPGSGLYRNVWLLQTSRTRFRHDGAFVTTPGVDRTSTLVLVQAEMENLGETPVSATLGVSLHRIGEDGSLETRPSARKDGLELELEPGRQALRSLAVRLKKPKLWGLEQPHRYAAVLSLRRTGKSGASGTLLDQLVVPFGVREVRVDAERGFLLNGRRVELRGVCQHHDLGALGAAVRPRAIERQLEILQGMGANAIRTAHNPPAPELLDACDRRGILVMDEAFDCWRTGKKTREGADEPSSADAAGGDRYLDYARVFDDWHERDLRALIRRDRNHPSVVMWSIGNEVIEQWQAEGWKLAARLAGIVREEDRTRPITGAFNAEQAGYAGFQTAVDVVGYNYQPGAYGPFHAHNPTVPVLGAETASSLSSRGQYFFPVSDDKLDGRQNFHVSDYGLSAAPWAYRPDEEFAGLDDSPFALGEFVWTGFDYLGEPTPYNSDSTNLLNFSDADERRRMAEELARLGKIQVPSRSSYFGIVDLAGFPKDRFYLYQARWRPNLRMAHLLPHWNWPERIGKITPVHLFSTADEAELFVNGKSQGRKRRKPNEYRFRWNRVRYQPGVLSCMTYKNGKPWARARRVTTGPASGVSLRADRTSLAPDGSDLSFVTARVVDTRGQVVPTADNRIQFRLRGPARIAAVDNGDPTSHESFQAPERQAFGGLLLVVVETLRGRRGRVELRAVAPGLSEDCIQIQVGK